VLANLGYSAKLQLSAKEERTQLASGYECGFGKSSGAKLVELKWRVLPHFYSVEFDLNDFFARSQRVDLGDFSARTLGSEDLFLVLCVHAAKHCWAQLSFFCDIAHLMRSQNLDWNFVEEQGDRLGICNILAITLLMSSDLLGTSVPAFASKRAAADRNITLLVNEAMRILRSSLEPSVEALAYFRFMMRLRERYSDRARFMWRLATTPTVSELLALPLPEALSPLYRPVRLFRIAKRLLRSARAA
jgi:hypothetical protein